MHADAAQRKIFLVLLIVIIVGTAVGSFVGTVTHNAALGFVVVVGVESGLLLPLLLLYLRR